MTLKEYKECFNRKDINIQIINYKSICGVTFEDNIYTIYINKQLSDNLRFYFVIWSLIVIRNKKIKPNEEIHFSFSITEEDIEAIKFFGECGYHTHPITNSELFTKKLKDKDFLKEINEIDRRFKNYIDLYK